MREAIEMQPSVEQHEYVLGEDSRGMIYIHFPQFCGADLRVYRQAPAELPTLDLPEPSPAKVGLQDHGWVEYGFTLLQSVLYMCVYLQSYIVFNVTLSTKSNAINTVYSCYGIGSTKS